MKKLSVVMVVLLGLALMFPVVGMAKNDVLCKATGGAQIENNVLGGTKVNFTFNAILYDGGSAKGSALWMDHEYGKTKFDVTEGYRNIDGSVSFRAEVISTDLAAFEDGYVIFTVTDGGKSGTDSVEVDWEAPDLDPIYFELQGGNIVVH